VIVTKYLAVTGLFCILAAIALASVHAEVQPPLKQLESGVPPADIQCRGDRIPVIRDGGSQACVYADTAAKTGWIPVHSDIVEVAQDQKHGVIQEFPLTSEAIESGFARFNVELSHRPVLNEEFDITISYEILHDETAKKEPRKTIPFTLTLSDGIDYLGGDMQKSNRKYSLVTEKYNTVYQSDNPKTTPRTYESTSTLKFSQTGEHYLSAYVRNAFFDTFWFVVDDDGTVHAKEEVAYDHSELDRFLYYLARDNPESIDKELEDVFGVHSKRVLEEYYQRLEHLRPIAPVDISTTKVQLRDIICNEDMFYKATQRRGGIECGAEHTLEGSNGLSEKTILVDTREAPRHSILTDPPYPDQRCHALYATFEIPEQVKIGKEFDVVLTYNWRLSNPHWDAMSESDKNTMRQLRDEYVPLAETIERIIHNPATTITEKEFDDLDDQTDTLFDQMEEIMERYLPDADLDKDLIRQIGTHKTVHQYDLSNADLNLYEYYIKNHDPECEEPAISITFPEEVEILSDGFSVDSRSDKHKVVWHSGEKTTSFSNDDYPQTSVIKLIVNEPAFHLVNSLNIDVVGKTAEFFFVTTDDVAAFSKNYPESWAGIRLGAAGLIDKFGNRFPLHEQGGRSSYVFYDGVLPEYGRLHNMTLEEQHKLQLEFIKHKILHSDDDFVKFYNIFQGKDISDEIDYVKIGPPMEDFSEFIRESFSKSEDDVEEWLMSQKDIHPDWIKEFLQRYPEFKN